MGDLVTVASLNDLPPGSSKVVSLDGKPVAIFNVSGTFYAIQNVCIHRGGPVGEGELEGMIVTCPWHGWAYDISTGASESPPGAQLPTYKVHVVGSEIKLERP